jgi:putative ABC transport system ATP-binding protein
VALARALAARPEVIFGDEPTGALDLSTGREVLALLRRFVDEFGATMVMVTHDPAAAAWADRVVFLADGKLAGELLAPTADQVSARMMELTR